METLKAVRAKRQYPRLTDERIAAILGVTVEEFTTALELHKQASGQTPEAVSRNHKIYEESKSGDDIATLRGRYGLSSSRLRAILKEERDNESNTTEEVRYSPGITNDSAERLPPDVRLHQTDSDKYMSSMGVGDIRPAQGDASRQVNRARDGSSLSQSLRSDSLPSPDGGSGDREGVQPRTKGS